MARKAIIFYSWQSDLPNKTNRGLIQAALELVSKGLSVEGIIVEVDRDTSGVPGAPDIGQTIFKKIEQSDIFVCDVSIVTNGGRPSPNPNVLIELGYALKTLGADRILMVLNTAFGGPELLPFDLRQKRVTTYESKEEDAERAPARKELAGKFDEGVRAILAGIIPPGEEIKPRDPATNLIESVENSKPSQSSLARKYMAHVTSELEKLNPDMSNENRGELLIESLKASKQVVLKFAQVCDIIATMNSKEAALSLYKSFETLLLKYDLPEGFSGESRRIDFDYFRILGHQLFVLFVAILLREHRLDILSTILGTGLVLNNTRRGDPAVDFTYISQPSELLYYESQKKQRVSLRAEYLRDTHLDEELKTISSFQDFMGADYLLYLRGQLGEDGKTERLYFVPWSSMYAKGTPRFMAECMYRKTAEQFLPVLGVNDIGIMRQRIKDRALSLGKLWMQSSYWDGYDYKIDEIGTR